MKLPSIRLNNNKTIAKAHLRKGVSFTRRTKNHDFCDGRDTLEWKNGNSAAVEPQ